jgi:gliding motility-associated-like protein
MKGFRKWFLVAFVLTGFSTLSYSQVQYSRKYRVVAYKVGQPQVFSISNEVEIIPPMSLYIPNTFTPNGDGLNDTFGVAGEAIKDINIQIFNRWGQLIFESADGNRRWDGTYQGEKVPMGSYVYKVSVKGASGNREAKEGMLSVVF